MTSLGKHWKLTAIQRAKHSVTKGMKRTDETKQRIRVSAIGNKNALGSKRPDLSLKNKTVNRRFGKDNQFYGKHHTEEAIAKNREKRLHQIFPNRDTSIEIAIQKTLKERGIEFERDKILFGRPDVFIAPNIAIFCDGDYWHNRPGSYEKDLNVNKTLTEQGYKVLRFWEHEINKDANACVDKIINFV